MNSDNNIKDKAIHKDFRRVFYKREGKELLGRNNRNLWVLIGILFITFTAIGFASGSLKYLKKKMDDPYINWVNVNIPPFGDRDMGQMVKTRLNRDTIAKTEYHFKNVTAYYRYPLAFHNLKAKGTIEVSGRSIDVTDPILGEIFKDKNRLKGRPFKNESDFGIIVTREFLERFGYDINTPVIQMAVALGENNQEFVPIPIIAVLKELPGMTMFATTPYFRINKKEHFGGNPFRRDGTREIIVFVPGDKTSGNDLKQSISDFFDNSNEFTDLSPWVGHTNNDQSYQKGFDVSVSFNEELSIETLDSIYSKIITSKELAEFEKTIIRNYTYKLKQYRDDEYRNFDYLAINFEDLIKVRDFQVYFFENYKLRIDIAQIEAKENYSYVSKLTLIISFILIIFSVLVISMFVSNILSRHLDKIKRNIGTFKAFGLSNKALLSIYFTLTTWFIVIAMMIAFLISLLFGSIGGIRLGLIVVKATIEQGESYFDLFNLWLLISTIMVLIVSMVVIYFTANSILKRTPGDLIYNRQ